MADVLPATIEHESAFTGSLFHVTTSSNPIPNPPAKPPMNASGQLFYQTLLGVEYNPIPVQELFAAIQNSTLNIQCGSNYNKNTQVTTSVWSFYSSNTIYEHTSNGIPSKTRRRAELLSIMAALYVLTVVQPPSGRINLFSNSKNALRDAFSQGPIGIT
jgi:hypothetical protein